MNARSRYSTLGVRQLAASRNGSQRDAVCLWTLVTRVLDFDRYSASLILDLDTSDVAARPRTMLLGTLLLNPELLASRLITTYLWPKVIWEIVRLHVG